MYKQIEERFKQEFILPELESRNQALNAIRKSRVSPMNHFEIEKDRKKYLREVKAITRKRREERKEARMSHSYSTKPFNNYFYSLVQKLDQEKQKKERDKIKAKGRVQEARIKFSHLKKSAKKIKLIKGLFLNRK